MTANTEQSGPSSPMIVCSVCLQTGKSDAFPIALTDEQADCPRCRTRFRLLSRYLISARNRRDDLGYRYLLLTDESGGRARPRALRTLKPIRFENGSWITLVWQGTTPVGVADQSSGRWQALPLPPKRIVRYGRVWNVALGACAALAVLYTVRITAQARSLASTGPSALLVWLAMTVAVLAPLAWWAVQTVRSPGDEADDPFAADDDPFVFDA